MALVKKDVALFDKRQPPAGGFSLSKIPAIALSSSRDFHILPEKF